MRTFDWAPVRRLLLIRLDNAGDVVMLSPAIRALRVAAPDARMTLLASPAGARAADLLPDIAEVIPHAASWQQLGAAPPPATELELIERLRRAAFDAAVVFTSFSQDPGPPALASYLAAIPQRGGWAPLFSGAVLSHPVEPRGGSEHQAIRNVELVRALGAPRLSSAIEVRIPGPATRRARAHLRSQELEPGGYVALLPGASASARRYPPERFADAARHLWVAAGLSTLVIGSDRDRQLAETVVREGGVAVRSIVGATDIPTAAALIERAALVLGNNSLALHLADAFGVPVVAAYAGTDLETQWAPRSSPARLLRRPTSCAPCYAIDCPFEQECLDIPGRELAEAAIELLHASAHGATRIDRAAAPQGPGAGARSTA